MGVRAGMVGVVNCICLCMHIRELPAHVQVTHMHIKVQCSMWQPISFPRPWNPRNVRVVFGTRMSVTSKGSTCNNCFANCFSSGIGISHRVHSVAQIMKSVHMVQWFV